MLFKIITACVENFDFQTHDCAEKDFIFEKDIFFRGQGLWATYYK